MKDSKDVTLSFAGITIDAPSDECDSVMRISGKPERNRPIYWPSWADGIATGKKTGFIYFVSEDGEKREVIEDARLISIYSEWKEAQE